MYIRLFVWSAYFCFCLPLKGQSIIINEIMADPTPTIGLPDAEYVELHNIGSTDVIMVGWTFYDGTIRALPDATIPANGFLIICAQGDSSVFQNYGLTAAVSSLSLTNSGDKIALRNENGVSIDSVMYTDDWYADPGKADGGFSLERIDSQIMCMVASNWRASDSPAGGTPGTMNSVHGTLMDEDPPMPLFAYCPDSTNIIVVFSEPIDLSSLWTNPSIELPAPLMMLSATTVNDLGTRISLGIHPAISDNVIYNMDIVGIKDCSGNIITQKTTLPFARKDTTNAGNIIINEVLFNPREEGYDFVELYNNSDRVVAISELSLAPVSIQTGNSGVRLPIAEEERFLYPGSFLLVSENTEAVSKQYSTAFPISFQQTASIPAMNIDEGMIALYADTLELDRVYYHEDYHHPMLIDRKGVSLERIHPDRQSLDQNSWHSASVDQGGASPGFKNTQYLHLKPPSKWVSVFPEMFSPDNDGYHDVVHFQINPQNNGSLVNLHILNTAGQLVFNYEKSRMSTASDVVTWNGITDRGEWAPPGIYIAVFELFHLKGEVKQEQLVFVLAQKID